ncbi:hypothetical protein VSDG_06093 [Cytospora chrysosperma]|uniref:FAD-binding PCMH-type domain-containing protein n=1 Tax=Cytospora chrysosperma TaxID=252740 RepID=A0A423VWE6_CYTCH|nr:hypothetical protein VSDG_06093 [Valsa sordida]
MAPALSHTAVLLSLVIFLRTTTAHLNFHSLGNIQARSFTMPQPFEVFAGSLGLAAVDAEKLEAALANASSPACTAAQVLLGSEIVDTSPLNETAVDANWSEACWEQPGCIIQPRTASDVATALKIIKQFGAPFAVRSGGHSPNPGFSSIQGGILLDLSTLDSISVSEDRETAIIGPGQRWGSVYDALDPYNVSVIGGRIPHVGVGGLILGGGYFHFSPKYGLAADNVKSFEVVLADGTITAASATENSDLFWALKGGGPNFGIVTSYELYTIPVRNIYYEVLVVGNENAHAVLDAFALWQNTTGATDTNGSVGLALGLQSITLGFVYSEPSAERPAAFSAFSDITPLVTAVPPTNGTVASLSVLLSMSDGPGRHDYRATATKIDAQLYKDVYDFWLAEATAVNAATGANQTFALQPIPPALSEASAAKGGNSMGIPQENHMWWTTLIDWENAADDDAVRNVSISTEAKWKELGKERGLSLDYLYTNDASRDQSPIATHGQDNIAKLKAIALKYDPDRVFQTLQNDGFLLSKA